MTTSIVFGCHIIDHITNVFPHFVINITIVGKEKSIVATTE